MNELQITEYKNIRVLTTQQIAEAYGSDTRVTNQMHMIQLLHILSVDSRLDELVLLLAELTWVT